MPANQKGVEFYNDLITELLSFNIQPFVTLFHWDFPQALQDEYNGFLSPKSVQDFKNYADFCFKTFGSKVKNWITFNEPWVYSHHGHYLGNNAPGRCYDRSKCEEGDSNTELYLSGHYQLLSHGYAVDIYRKYYQNLQKGIIGITLNCDWYEPYSISNEDRQASQRMLEFHCGWFGDPVYFGDYPESMKNNIKNRLPSFTEEEKKIMKGSNDFFGLNHYTSRYSKNGNWNNSGYEQDSQVINSIYNDNGNLIGNLANPGNLYSN
jgi:beta-glucosidase